MLEMRQIQVFLAVSELLNFSRAAEKIHLSQPTVSSHLKTLERYLGVELIERGNREIRLTPAGELFRPYAQRIFALQERARKELARYSGALSGSLEIGGSNTPGQYVLPRMIGAFSSQRETVRITLRIGDSSEIITRVGDGELELALVGAPAPAGEFESRCCPGDELILAASPKLSTNFPHPATPESLRKLPFIIREQGSATRRVMFEALREFGIRGPGDLKIVAEMGGSEALRQGLKNRLGAAVISELAIREDLASGELVQIPLPGAALKRPFYLVTNRNHKLSPLGRALADYILQQTDETQ
jgi:DNA-binding transcriptional LysR family regulator